MEGGATEGEGGIAETVGTELLARSLLGTEDGEDVRDGSAVKAVVVPVVVFGHGGLPTGLGGLMEGFIVSEFGCRSFGFHVSISWGLVLVGWKCYALLLYSINDKWSENIKVRLVDD